MTPKERATAEAAVVARNLAVKTEADKALTELGTLRKEVKAERDSALKAGFPADSPLVQALDADLKRIAAARTRLVGIEIGAELPGLAQVGQSPMPKGGVVTALWGLHGPGDISNDPLVDADLIHDLSHAVDAFNGGATSFTLSGGQTIDLATFRDRLADLAEGLEFAMDDKLGQKAIDQVKTLLTAVDLKIGWRAATSSFEALLDRSPGFPIGGAMRAITAALPNLRTSGESADPGRLVGVARDVTTLAEMIRAGDSFPNLQGHDPTFDAAALKLKQERGGDMALEHLRQQFAANGRSFPGPAVLALAGKPDDQLTVKERAALLDLVGTTKQATLGEARAILKEVNDAREAGRTAATLRHELTTVNEQLARVLTADRRRWYKPWTWGDSAVKVFTAGPQSVLKDANLMKALAKFGDAKTGRDVAILMASLSRLEAETLKAEKTTLGLHPNFVPPSATPDPANPLAHIGISNHDLAAIGLDATDLAEVGKAVANLTRQGVGSVDDVMQVTKSINDVSRIVLRSELAHGLLQQFEGESARTLGQHLVADLVADADLAYRRAHNMPDLPPDLRLKQIAIDDPNVTGHFKTRTAALKTAFDKADPHAWNQLQDSARTYRGLEGDLVRAYQGHQDVEAEMARQKKLLADETASGALGITVDAHAPRGLTSAKAILNALRAEEDFQQSGNPQDARRRDAALEELRGFDDETMRKPWHAKVKVAFGGGDVPDIARLQQLRQVAEAIVYIRETGPEHMEALRQQVEGNGAALDMVLAQRREAAPGTMQRVTDMIRLAVLSEWSAAKTDFTLKDGTVSEGFNPSIPPARTAIEKRLTEWGLPLDRFAPELDDVLYSRLSADDVIQWATEARWSSATIAAYREAHPERLSRAGIRAAFAELAHQFTPDALLHRRVMDDGVKGSLLGMIEGFQEGDKLDLKAGQRITLDSGKIPVEPTGLAGIKAKLAMAHIGQFEIERGGDGYKLHLRTGLEGKGNLDAVVGKKFGFGDHVELSAEGSLGLEGSGSRLSGMTLSFKGDAAGRKALIDLVAKMIDGDEIDLWDWQDASDVGSATENRAKFGANIGATGRMQVGGKGPDVGGVKDTLGVGLVGTANASVTRGTKDNVTESLKETTRKGEVEYSATVGASLGFYARLYNPTNIGTGMAATQSGGQKSADQTLGKDPDKGKSLFNMVDNVSNMDIATIGVSATATYVDKWKQVTDAQGIYTKCETVRQANVRQGLVQAFAVCDTPEMRRILADPGNAEFAQNFAAFMKLAGPADFIAVTYGLKPAKLAEANELVRRANAARRQGNEDMALAFEKLARKIVNNDANFIPTKIGLVTTTVEKSEVSNLNARFIRWDTFSDGKAEHTGATLAIPAPK
jgi:hypothetical protein